MKNTIMGNADVIATIANALSNGRTEITEAEIKAELIKNKIYSARTMESLMDSLEANGVEVKADMLNVAGYDEDEEAENLNPVKLYFADIARYPLLSAEEEKELLKKAKEGDKMAEEKLVNSNLRLVVSIAKRYTYKAELLDLINSGNMGLLNAIRHFDAGKGTKLSTYATWWIKQSIGRMIANCGSTIRLPVFANEIVRNMSAYMTKFAEDNGRDPKTSEIAEHFGVTDETVDAILLTMGACTSLDTPIASDEGSITTQGDLIADNTVDVEGDVMAKMRRNDIMEVLHNVLTEKESYVLCARHGLVEDGEPKTLEEIGMNYGVSRERIRQIEKKAYAKLRSSEEVFERLYTWLTVA